jgi:hypothetical protein
MRGLLAALLLASAAPASASASAGAESFDSLLADPSARAVALGGAYTALATDAHALFYNPAGLGQSKAYQAAFTHQASIEGARQESLGFSSRDGWSADFSSWDSGGIPRTRLDAPDGGLGDVGMKDMAFGGGYGTALNESLSVGVGAKYLRETIDAVTATAFAADAGLLALVPGAPGLSLGAAVLNVGRPVQFDLQREQLPRLVRAGAAYAFAAGGADQTLAFDLTKTRTDKVRFSLGVESVVMKTLALRLGYDGRQDAGPGVCAGVGFFWRAMSVDYAFAPFGALGDSHRVGLSYRWGEAEEEREPEPRAETETPKVKEAPSPVPDDDGDLRRVRYDERTGRDLAKDGDVAGAKAAFSEAIQLAFRARLKDPVVADAYAGMARCLVRERRNDYAVRFFNKALEAGPTPEARVLILRELDALSGPRGDNRPDVDGILGN